MCDALLKSRLHMARITGACLEYEGSLTIDRDLMDDEHNRPKGGLVEPA